MINLLRRSWLRLAAGACAALALSSAPAIAQDWPTRPVRIVIAGAAGSSGDQLARLIAPKLEAVWKQPVIVENKPGAGGIIGTEYVVNATDGHTLLLASSSSILPKYTTKNLRFDPFTDLVPVYKMFAYQYFMVTNAETAKRAPTLREFVALSKSSPVFFAGMGPTAIFNLSMAAMNNKLGVQYTPVDFNGIGPMNIALIRNDAQLVVNTPSSLMAQVEAGQVVPLAVISPERYSNLPNVPTLAEAVGYNGYIPQIWAGFMAPKGMPPVTVDRISRDLLAVTSDPETKKLIETRVSGKLQRSSPAAFSKDIAEEGAVWKDVFTRLNIKPE